MFDFDVFSLCVLVLQSLHVQDENKQPETGSLRLSFGGLFPYLPNWTLTFREGRIVKRHPSHHALLGNRQSYLQLQVVSIKEDKHGTVGRGNQGRYTGN